MANPAETAYISFRDRELSNEVWLVEFRRRKVVVHTLWVVPGHCLRAGFMESRNFCVLRLILVKFHIRTRLGLFPPLPISLADRNGLKNLSRHIFSKDIFNVRWSNSLGLIFSLFYRLFKFKPEFHKRKMVVHTFLWVIPGHCLRAGFI